MSLWQEYAIEPSLFGDYSQARYLLDDFGMDSGRLIGGFPRKWQKAVRNHLSKCSDLQRKTIIERLNKLNRVIVPRTHPFDGNIAWKVQAFECDRIKPFHAIITDGPDPHSKAIDGTALLDAFPLWKAAGQTKVPRTADELASAIEVILRQCHEIIIVDREFIPSGGTNNKWLKPFASLAKILVQQNSVQRIELNALDKPLGPWPPGKFVSDCSQHLPRFIPNGMSVTANLWRQRIGGIQVHKRLILTDMGGVLLDPGLDEGKPGEMYDIKLLHDSECANEMRLFNTRSGAHDLVDSIVVQGQV